MEGEMNGQVDGWMDEQVNGEQSPSDWLPVQKSPSGAVAAGGQWGCGLAGGGGE